MRLSFDVIERSNLFNLARMASIERQYLVPEERILFKIFAPTVELNSFSCHIISNTFDTCTFRVQHDVPPLPGCSTDFIVRLETSQGRLAAVTALQRLGRTQLGDLIPNVLHVGNAITMDGRQVEYSVSEYCTGTVPLEDVWNTLDKTNQLDLVDFVAQRMQKLQKLNISDIRQYLPESPYVLDRDSQHVARPIGGPSLGYFPNVKQFLGGLLQSSNQTSPACKLPDLDGGIALESIYADVGRVELSHSDLDNLQQHAVFCHNDLEPRNILVRKVTSTKETSEQYEVAALIDWEMAGFYPFAYEYGLKDTILGLSNLSFSWYALFKERTSHLLPQEECHTKFVEALRIIDQSKKRRMTRNVGVRFQAKWIEREQVEISDFRQGWVRKSGAGALKAFSEDDRQVMEQEVLKELGYV
jgi:hypothetical protein